MADGREACSLNVSTSSRIHINFRNTESRRSAHVDVATTYLPMTQTHEMHWYIMKKCDTSDIFHSVERHFVIQNNSKALGIGIQKMNQ